MAQKKTVDHDFGLTAREASFLRRLSPPWRLQRYLDTMEYDGSGRNCRSPRRMLSEKRAQCMDGALLAAAALRLQGHPPLIVDLEAEQDADHVVAVFRGAAGWGAVAFSDFGGLRYREPIFRSIRDLALSYFEQYFNLRREKTLRRYSQPVSLSRFDRHGWMTSDEDLWYIPEHLVGVRHYRLLPPAAERSLATVDRRTFEGGRPIKGH